MAEHEPTAPNSHRCRPISAIKTGDLIITRIEYRDQLFFRVTRFPSPAGRMFQTLNEARDYAQTQIHDPSKGLWHCAGDRDYEPLA